MDTVITFTQTESGTMPVNDSSVFPTTLAHPARSPVASQTIARTLRVQPPLTLSQFYFDCLWKTRVSNNASDTVRDDRAALAYWSRHTSDPDLRSLAWSTEEERLASLRSLRIELQTLVRSLQAHPLSSVTINRVLRSLRTMFRAAADPIDFNLIAAVPSLGKQFTGTHSAWQLKESRQKPRKTIGTEELERLFHATAAADDPHLWKCIIVMLWTYGARTEDTFFNLDWSLIDLDAMVMQFTANKTSKLQGVPLTPLMVSVLKSLAPRSEGRIFGKIARGHWCQKEGWKRGYYTTWSRDILPAGRFSVNRGPAEHQLACAQAADVRPNLMFHHFRKTMVTELNIYSGQAGNWVAAHYMSGVSEKYYDTPTERIARAVAERERDRLAKCFGDYFLNLHSVEGNPNACSVEKKE